MVWNTLHWHLIETGPPDTCLLLLIFVKWRISGKEKKSMYIHTLSRGLNVIGTDGQVCEFVATLFLWLIKCLRMLKGHYWRDFCHRLFVA